MKRSSSILLILILLAGLIYLFLENRKLRDELNNTHFYVSEGSINPDTLSLKYLHYSKAKAMVDTFTASQYRYITDGLNNDILINTRNNGKPVDSLRTFWDSRLISFSLDSIKRLVYTMDELVKNGKIKKPDGKKVTTSELGIKIYYAAYPGLEYPPNYNSKDGRHTLILVPAYKDASGYYHDFLPSGKLAQRGFDGHSLLSAVPHKGDARMMLLSAPAQTSADDGTDVGLNDGTVCPPPND
ncbi:MAG: hypothetical protein J7539_02755 [Niabella sp.]|nr:hypothetical protein [Niabella sp.]